MEALARGDAECLQLDGRSAPLHFGNLAIYESEGLAEGRDLYEAILDYIRGHLHLAPAFRRRAVPVPGGSGNAWWYEDNQFDLEFHVRHIRLPLPGDWAQLCTQAARSHSRQLDPSRPLWEITIIEGLDAVDGLKPGSFAVLFKQHAASAAPFGGMNIEAALHVRDPAAPIPVADKPWMPDPEPDPRDLMTRAFVSGSLNPFLRPGTSTWRPRTGSAATETQPAAPTTRLNLPVSVHRTVAGRRFSLNALRAMRRTQHGTTVHDIVLALCGGALRNLLSEVKDLPRQSATALAPIAVESKGSTVAEPIFLELGTHLADPIERIEHVRSQTASRRALKTAVGARVLTQYGVHFPSVLIGQSTRLAARVAASGTQPRFNVALHNAPGPSHPLFFAGARMQTRFGLSALMDRVGLGLTVQSYGGELTLAATACRDLVSSSAQIEAAFDAAWQELEEPTVGRGRLVMLHQRG